MALISGRAEPFFLELEEIYKGDGAATKPATSGPKEDVTPEVPKYVCLLVRLFVLFL